MSQTSQPFMTGSWPASTDLTWWQEASAIIMRPGQDAYIEPFIADSESRIRQGRSMGSEARFWKDRGLAIQAGRLVATRAEARVMKACAVEADQDLASGNLTGTGMARALRHVQPSAVFGMPGGASSPTALRKGLLRMGLSAGVADYLLQRPDVRASFRRSARIRLTAGLIALVLLFAPLPAAWLAEDPSLASVIVLFVVLTLYHTIHAAYLLLRYPAAAPPMINVPPIHASTTPPAAASRETPSVSAIKSSRFCGRCGTPSVPEDTFCRKCGVSLTTS